jgi:hypothetical protein
MARAPADQLECKGAQSITCRCRYGWSGDMADLVRRSEAIKYLQVYLGFFHMDQGYVYISVFARLFYAFFLLVYS